MRRRSVLTAVLAGALTLLAAPGAQAVESSVVCRFSDDRFDEISGMTYSQRHKDVLYVHNDSSGGPYLYAVDARTCRTLATLRIDGIDGIEARDLEAIGSGRDARGRPILWLGDIGDNRDSWPEVRVHRVREPAKLVDRTMKAITYRFTYPDRPHNAEALLTDPRSSKVWVVTKQLARGSIYALPDPLVRREVNIAKRVSRAGALVTDGAVSPDASRFVLRDYVDAEVFQGLPPGANPRTVYLPIQFQGEAVTWTPDGRALLIASERDDRLMRVEVPSATSARSLPTLEVRLASDTAGPADVEEAPVSDVEETAWTYIFLGAVFVIGAVVLFVVTEVRRRRSPDAGDEQAG